MQAWRIVTIGSAVTIALLSGGTGVASGGESHAPSSHTAKHQTGRFYFNSTTIKVRSSNGTRLRLAINGSGQKGATSSDLNVTLSSGPAQGLGETHIWQFQLPKSGVVYSSKTGRGHLASKKKLRAFGTVSLAFKKGSQHTSKCVDGTAPNNVNTDVTGRLSGKVFFNTKSHGWGSVGSRKHPIHFPGHSHLTMSGTGCPAGYGSAASCSKEIYWDSPYVPGSTVTFSGRASTSGKKQSTISASDYLQLPKPVGASRDDFLVTKAPTPTRHGGTLHIKTSGKVITGSATIANATSQPDNYKCKLGGKTKHEKTKYYSGAWTSTDLTAHFRVLGDVTPPSTTGTGSFSVETY